MNDAPEVPAKPMPPEYLLALQNAHRVAERSKMALGEDRTREQESGWFKPPSE